MKAARIAAWVVLTAASGAAFVAGSLGSSRGVSETLLVAIPVWCAAIAAAVPLKAGLYNLGAEGQIYIGATAAAAFSAFLQSRRISGIVAVAACLLAASWAGGVLGWLAGAGRAFLRLNEAVTSILLNFVAVAVARYAAAGPLKDPSGIGYPWTSVVPEDSRLGPVSPLFPQIPRGALITALAASLAWIFVFRTRAGLEVRAIGSNPEAAVFTGIAVRRRTVQVMALGGIAAGLGGGMELLGHQLRLGPFFSPGLGFTGLVAAVVTQSAGLLLAIVALLLATLRTGFQTAERLVGIPAVVSYVIQGALLAVAAFASADRNSSGLRTLRLRARRPRRISSL